MSPIVQAILAIYAVFALAMLIVVWPMCVAAKRCDDRDKREREMRMARRVEQLEEA
ncbi:MAG TPA: hypothetical protein VF783_13905 [Terriglobales bacterium]